jgi:nucleoside-diphosphate-sugar epimerase
VEWKNKRILVTGGAGFIGSRVAVKLVERGASVRVVDDLSKGEAANLAEVLSGIEFIQDDLLDRETARQCLKGVDVCFHFAAKIGGIGFFHRYPATSIRDNTLMNLNLWDAAKEAGPKMVCVSSSMVFERTSVFPTPEIAVESSPPPLTGYGFSKLVAEYISRTYYEEFSVPYVIVRPFNAYGPGEMPGDYVGLAHVIPDLINKVLSGQYPLEILGSGKQLRSYTYVDDVAEGIIFVAERVEADDFNIGAGGETNVIELAKMIWNISGRKETIKFRHLPPLKYDVQRRVPDVSKVRGLGWQAKIPLEEGLRNTIQWFKKRGSKN